jgi:hypothetical protein
LISCDKRRSIKKIYRDNLYLVVIIFIVICSSLFINQYKDIEYAKNRATIYLYDDFPSYTKAKNILEKEIEDDNQILVVFSHINKNQVIKGSDIARHISAEIIEILGDSTAISTSFSKLSSTDKMGCLVSSKVAETIFGTRNIQGKSIIFFDKEYIIRGIFESDKAEVFCNARNITDKNDEIIFERVNICAFNKNEISLKASDFAMKYNLIGAMVEWRILLGSFLNVLPSKWSDFSFWYKEWENIKSTVTNAIYLENIGFERVVLTYSIRLLILITINSILISVFAVIVIKSKKSWCEKFPKGILKVISNQIKS